MMQNKVVFHQQKGKGNNSALQTRDITTDVILFMTHVEDGVSLSADVPC